MYNDFMELQKLLDKDFISQMGEIVSEKKNGEWVEIVRQKSSEHIKSILPSLDKSKLQPIKTYGHELPFIDNWNKFLKGTLKSYDYENFVYDWENHFTHLAIMSSCIGKKDPNVMEKIIRGRLDISFKNCQVTGEHLVITLDDNLNFKVIKSVMEKVINSEGKEGMRFKEMPLGEATFKNTIKEHVIEFKTGNLIINDWFRTPNDEFKNQVRKKEFESINYTQGRVNQILHYASQNFVSVNIGNSCASVYVKEGNIYIGEGPELKKGAVYKGNICTDLWNGTIIDEAQFVEILMKAGMTKAKAEKELENQKKIWTCISIKVKPGKYKLSFCGNYEEFNKKYRTKNKKTTLPKEYKPYFCLERITDKDSEE